MATALIAQTGRAISTIFSNAKIEFNLIKKMDFSHYFVSMATKRPSADSKRWKHAESPAGRQCSKPESRLGQSNSRLAIAHRTLR